MLCIRGQLALLTALVLPALCRGQAFFNPSANQLSSVATSNRSKNPSAVALLNYYALLMGRLPTDQGGTALGDSGSVFGAGPSQVLFMHSEEYLTNRHQ